MKILYIILITLLLESQSFTQWILLTSGTSEDLYSVNFTSVDTGWAVGRSKILKTTNGGITWINQSPSSSLFLRCAFFLTSSTGWVAGSHDDILKTTNGGNTWSIQNAITDNNWHQIFFLNANTGWMVGTWGRIVKTTNGGLNWISQNSGLNTYLYSVYFLDFNRGWIAGDNGVMLRTTNGGTLWSSFTALPNNNLREVIFTSPTTGWVSGAYGNILKSSDGGITWNLNNSLGVQYGFEDIYFINQLTGWVVGDIGEIFKTTNGGNNWVFQTGGGSNVLVGITFTSENTGYIAGFGGAVFKTINGGAISVQPISEIIPDKFTLSQNYPNPFNPVTHIEFDVKHNSHVKIVVYDILGRQTAVLADDFLEAGSYRTSWDASHLSSGTYFYRMIASDYSSIKKMIVSK